MLDEATRLLVITRAHNACEYCLMAQEHYEATFHVEHIVAQQHALDDRPSNLALCCPRCNRKKGPNLAGIDPISKTVIVLFNPRTAAWTDHFKWEGPIIVGLSPCGRATTAVLDLNGGDRIRLRQALIAEGVFPRN